MKQIILVRTDLNMSTGKLAAQVAHGSNAFLLDYIKEVMEDFSNGEDFYPINYNIYNEWICGDMTKVVLKAREIKDFEKAIRLSEGIGARYFKIVDLCRTELEKETEEGTWTVLAFEPLENEVADKIGKKFQLL